MSLTTISEDIPPGGKNWYQKIVDRWAAVNANFSLLLTKINAVSAAAVKTINGSAPDGNGNVAVSTGTPADVQVFTASGTWTKPTGAKFVQVLVFGAGGSGQGQSNPNTAASQNAFGGGGGGLAEGLLPASALPSTVPVTVGAGGVAPTIAARTANTGLSVSGGVNGGDSSFGGLVSASGGQYFNGANNIGQPGYGGNPVGVGNPQLYPTAPGHGASASAIAGTDSNRGGASGGGSQGVNPPQAGIGGKPSGDSAAAAATTTTANVTTQAGTPTSRTGTGRPGGGGGGAASFVSSSNSAGVLRGGAGAIPGGGGGGASAGGNGAFDQGSVKAGDGARGEVIVITTF